VWPAIPRKGEPLRRLKVGRGSPGGGERETHRQPSRCLCVILSSQPATSNQQPATSNQQPATSNQQPATSDQRPATSPSLLRASSPAGASTSSPARTHTRA